MKRLAFCRKNVGLVQNHGLGMDSDKMCEASTTKNTPKTSQIIRPIYSNRPKPLGYYWKEFICGVCSPWIQARERKSRQAFLDYEIARSKSTMLNRFLFGLKFEFWHSKFIEINIQILVSKGFLKWRNGFKVVESKFVSFIKNAKPKEQSIFIERWWLNLEKA